jgi:hypothetical protein
LIDPYYLKVSNETVNMVFNQLIEVMIKNNYETLNIDQLNELRIAFIKEPLTGVEDNDQ